MGLIDRPAAPDRLSIDPEYIKELAASIIEVGLLSPILLSPRGGRFEIVAGDCRYQAFLSLGRDAIPAIIQDLDDENISIVRATENLQKKDLTVIEEARIYKVLHDKHNMSWDKIAQRVGKSPGLVRRRYELLEMPEILIKAMHEGKIGYAVAEHLSRLSTLGRIEYWLYFAIENGATKEQVARWVNEELLQARLTVSAGGGGGGDVVIPRSLPVYVPCDLCAGPMTIGSESVIRCCPECAKKLNEILKQ